MAIHGSLGRSRKSTGCPLRTGFALGRHRWQRPEGSSERAARRGQGGAAGLSRWQCRWSFIGRANGNENSSTTASEGVVHGVTITDWDQDGRDESSRSRIHRHSAIQVRARTAIGPTPKSRRAIRRPGRRAESSEIAAAANLGKERFLATVEPWHGNQVVVYRAGGVRLASRSDRR